MRHAALFAAFVLGACASQPVDDVAGRVASFNGLLAEQWEWTLRESPEFATILGDTRYNDRWSDISLAHREQQRRDTADFLARFQAIDPAGFAEQDRLSHTLMVRQLEDDLRAHDLKLHEMPIEQVGGAHLRLPQLVALFPFESRKHYEEYLARLHQLPRLVDDLIGVLRQGKADGLMPPRYLLEKTVEQCDAIAAPNGESSAFAQPLTKMPESLTDSERTHLHYAIVRAIDTQVRPAYHRLARFIADEYAPAGRGEPGIWALPGGDGLYRFLIEQQTTTTMDPDAIHALGLAEVERIEAQQAEIAKQLGHKSLAAMRRKLAKDPKAHARSRQQILDLYRKYTDRMEAKLPELFGLLPKTGLEIFPIEEFREAAAPGAEYQRGTPDGKRPGRVMVNTGDFAKRPLANIETTAYHEGLPGHHMQIAIAQTLPELPPFRQQGGYTAYIEGWALYSERVARELGFFEDPLSLYGHLDDELLRANRLVLDTGVHHKHWTRKQMVDWFRAHSAQGEPTIQAETDRYIAWPGQALAYKIGQLRILALRQKASDTLGDRFDLRAFHDHILGGGALPLDVLESRFDRWLAAQATATQP